ncbi:MAG: hypothetical protein SA339_04645 [Methanomassiliicoccus sp.]|nr:hypothetical protein [Methanomassiliicoccus sp.]
MVDAKLSTFPKKWLAILLVLAVVSPIGILVVWDYGDAWGEWGEVGEWAPQQFWNAPFPDYDLSGWEGQFMASLGYIISALVGVVAIIVVTYLLSKALARKNNDDSSG